nr:KamA family radical SAM protein [Dehalobacterium formicoaceticum]
MENKQKVQKVQKDKQDQHENNRVSIARAAELKDQITDYLEAKNQITVGLEIQEKINERKEKIKKLLNADENDWHNWQWQLSHRVDHLDTLSKIINLSKEEKLEIQEVEQVYRWAVSPYYCSLMDEFDTHCPIRLISLPQGKELADATGILDPMQEEQTNPAGVITRRYPDRLIINVTSECSSYCRFCQRRRNIGCHYGMASQEVIAESIDYIKNNKEIRDVLITGGDPLILGTPQLESILGKIRAIPHVEIIRIGTRVPVTLPMRITKDLCEMLKKYHPVYINTHFNHPLEISEESKEGVERLADAGIPVGNQMVLLQGINNDKNIVKRLNQELLRVRVKPYYIFHPKSVKGTAHFKCSIDEGIEVMEHLRGYTSGLAIPQYIVNAPNGLGKVPILPQYLISRGKGYFVVRTWEGKIVKIDDK